MFLDALVRPEISVSVGDHTYAISSAPTRGVFAATLVVLALVVATGVLRRPAAMVLAGAMIAAAFFGFGTALVMFPFEGGHQSVTTVFHDALVVHMLGSSIGAAGFVSALILGIGTGVPRRVMALGAAGMLCALGLVFVSASRGGELRAVGELPFFTIADRDDLHVGHERDAKVQLSREPRTRLVLFWSTKEEGPQPLEEADAALWSPPARVHVRAEAEGSFPVVVEARRGVVRLQSKVYFRGRAEIASPLLPLRVGNRWVYRVVTTEDSGHLLYFKTIGGGESVERLEIEVTGVEERDGFRSFTIETRGSGHGNTSHVVAVGGKTVFIDHMEALGEPVIDTKVDIGTEPVPCSVALLRLDGTCQLGGADQDTYPERPKEYALDPRKRAARKKKESEIARLPARFALAGPSSFERSEHSTAGALGTGFLALLTIGLVILPNGSHTSYALVETHRGPDGAPEAR